jgi:adenosine deaminase
MSLSFCQALAKVELHAHLNGSLTDESAKKLEAKHREMFPKEDIGNYINYVGRKEDFRGAIHQFSRIILNSDS